MDKRKDAGNRAYYEKCRGDEEQVFFLRRRPNEKLDDKFDEKASSDCTRERITFGNPTYVIWSSNGLGE